MKLITTLISLLIGVNYAQAETYKCSAIWGLESWKNEEPYRPSNDKIPNLLVKAVGDVAIVVKGKQEPELYSLVVDTERRSIYQWYDYGWLHTIYLDKLDARPLVYYNMTDPEGFRVVYNYKC